MTKAKTAVEPPQVSTVLIDETFEVEEGKSLRLVFDLTTTFKRAQDMAKELRTTRRIPFDIENLSARDPVLMHCVQQYGPQIKSKLLSDSDVLFRASQFYREVQADAEQDALLIALFDLPENMELLAVAPDPYPQVEDVADPLAVQMPVIVKNIAWASEKRLKRLRDLLIKSARIFTVNSYMETLNVRMNVFAQELIEVDKAGFQPEPVNG